MYFEKSTKTLSAHLGEYDRKYWSNYDVVGTIASPAYHELHIALLRVMFEITSDETFTQYYNCFIKYQKNYYNKTRATIRKFIQKITEHTDAVLIQ